ncbi:MAG: GGDEF domain-containing protein, partial [Planctomycetaceae bacterium]
MPKHDANQPLARDHALHPVVLPVALALAVLAGVLDAVTTGSPLLRLLYVPALLAVAWRFGTLSATLMLAGLLLFRLRDNLLSFTRGRIEDEAAWFGGMGVMIVLTVALRRSVARQRELARLDALTGLLNQQGLHERLDAEINRARRSAEPLSLAFIDCDHFKAANDRFGHVVGDRLLQTVAETLAAHLRNYDAAARVGGDEFAVVLPGTTSEAGQHVARRLHDGLNAVMREHEWPVTFSIGVATFSTPPDTALEAIAQADRLMYT